jgi:YkoP domain
VTAEPHLPWTEAPIGTAIGGRTGRRSTDLWAGSIGWLDGLIRVCYGVYEYTDDPDCLLRVAISPARAPVSLADGTRIQLGEPIGTVHCWNEHFPRYPAHGPDLRWACTIRHRVRRSLNALADHIVTEPAWRDVRALCAEAVLSSRLGWPQVQRVAQRYGFERVTPPASALRRLHALGEGIVLWGLTHAFNPAALARQPFLREHHELWISRAELVARYGHPIAAARPRSASPDASRAAIEGDRGIAVGPGLTR